MSGLISSGLGLFGRHLVQTWIPVPAPARDPGIAGMTILGYLIVGVTLGMKGRTKSDEVEATGMVFPFIDGA